MPFSEYRRRIKIEHALCLASFFCATFLVFFFPAAWAAGFHDLWLSRLPIWDCRWAIGASHQPDDARLSVTRTARPWRRTATMAKSRRPNTERFIFLSVPILKKTFEYEDAV